VAPSKKPMFRVVGFFALITPFAVAACSTDLQTTSVPGTEERPDEDRGDPGKPSSEPVADSGPPSAPKDAGTDTATPTNPSNPLCQQAGFGLGSSGYTSRDTAMDVPFSPSMNVSGFLGLGTPSGTPDPRWFTFVVPTARNVNVTFGGTKAYAAFYFETETASQFSVGTTKGSQYDEPLRAGRYYVALGDLIPRYGGAGPLVNVYMGWSTPPPECVDGGI
jgi:hypothetical protein